LPAYRQRIGERFGIGISISSVAPVIWIHAVSVGETQAAIPLVNSLRANYPAMQILFTTTTPTGSERVRSVFGDNVIHYYAPYDLPDVVRRFLNQARPRLVIILETELWPNLLYFCRRRAIPVILANARLSIRSFRGYQYIFYLACFTVRQFSTIATQSLHDAQRFQQLGALPKQIRVTGNIKFDLDIPQNIERDAEKLRELLGEHRPIWIAASTHKGEEALILNAHTLILHRHPSALLILVPRHPERFQEVAQLCRNFNFSIHVWSDQTVVPSHCKVYLGNTVGRLLLFYAVADAAFVGGSLVEHGGHNPLEPAALAIPIVFGPHGFNFSEINRLLCTAGGAYEVRNEKILAVTISDWLENPPLRREIGERARQVIESHRGALIALMRIIAEQIDVN